MSDPNLDDTQPIKSGLPNKSEELGLPADSPGVPAQGAPVGPENIQPSRITAPFLADFDDSDNEVPLKPRKARRWLVILGGIVLVFVLSGVGGYLGYLSAQAARETQFAQSVTKLATEQFMLGLQAQSDGRYDLARQHIEYVIQLDPNFPGARDKLTEVMLSAASTTTPTPEVILPTITPSPTPDVRGEEEIFNNAKALMANKEWVQALQVLDTLRDKNLIYRAVEVDGMYYVSLRHRGLIKVNSGELEGGLYDLALVERFGPLDIDAQGVRTWARLYLAGSRFWGVRWDKVVEAFADIYPYFPSMHDGSGMTATERFRIASIKYGDQLAAAGSFCDALNQYQNAQSITNDPGLDPTVTAVFTGCNPATSTPGPTLSPTPMSTITVAPTLESSPTTEVATPSPTDTPPPPETPTETPTETPIP